MVESPMKTYSFCTCCDFPYTENWCFDNPKGWDPLSPKFGVESTGITWSRDAKVETTWGDVQLDTVAGATAEDVKRQMVEKMGGEIPLGSLGIPFDAQNPYGFLCFLNMMLRILLPFLCCSLCNRTHKGPALKGGFIKACFCHRGNHNHRWTPYFCQGKRPSPDPIFS